MLLQYRHGKFIDLVSRKAIVDMIAKLVVERGNFQPYMPNEGEHSFWTIDSGNDWKIKFHDDKPDCIELIYRYQDSTRNPQVECLAQWLVCRTGARLVLEDGRTLSVDELPEVMRILGQPSTTAVA